jgi:hypothetical protein
MKPQTTTNLLLFAIALLLFALVLRPIYAPPPVHAQSPNSNLWIEPGTFLLRAPDNRRQVLGKVAIDLRNGNVWGLPTNSAVPFPSDPVSTRALTTHPFLLGRFALEDIR